MWYRILFNQSSFLFFLSFFLCFPCVLVILSQLIQSILFPIASHFFLHISHVPTFLSSHLFPLLPSSHFHPFMHPTHTRSDPFPLTFCFLSCYQSAPSPSCNQSHILSYPTSHLLLFYTISSHTHTISHSNHNHIHSIQYYL